MNTWSKVGQRNVLPAVFAVVACLGTIAPAGTVSATFAAETLQVLTVTAPTRVLPGGKFRVTVRARNVGTIPWTVSNTQLVLAGERWRGATLTLASAVAPGAEGVFSSQVNAPSAVGRYSLSWLAYQGATAISQPIPVALEITCSDGVFCNGIERFANGKCVAGRAPCDDGETCTTDTCVEASGACTHALAPGCPECAAKNCNPSCHNRTCGDDGCGGSCGVCGAGGSCVNGGCLVVTTPGTCANPIPLLAPGEPIVGTHVVEGDTTAGINGTVPTCNTATTARDLVYTFTLSTALGIDFRSSGYDTVLSLRSVACGDSDPAMVSQPNWCNDDASPPGNYGSRLATTLQPGTYYLLVDGYSGQQVGPFTLSLSFVEGCVPQCDGKYCGADGCGGTCGTCGAGTECSASTFRCVTSPCTPDCRGRQCGSDGCGGTCGTCGKDDQICVESEGACRTFAFCDHDRPVCKTACASTQFCGTDCQCHRLRDDLPDLIVDRDMLLRDMHVTTEAFGAASCAIVEGCVDGPGDRRLLRFATAAVNQGGADLVAPDAASRPDLFAFSACHGHYHYEGFAEYQLRDGAGNVVRVGHKQAYCMEDSYQAIDGPELMCTARYTCESQGIQAGWADLYGADLDCQWIDITDVPPGSYELVVSVNPSRTFEEVTFDNNTTTVPVTIP